MVNFIQELQQKVHDKKISVQEVVGLAMLVAQKLGLDDFQKQMEEELNGYEEDANIPSYRRVKSSLKGLDHICQKWKPVFCSSKEQHTALTTHFLRQPIGDLENLIRDASSGFIKIPLDEEKEQEIILGLEGLNPHAMLPSEVTRFLDCSQVDSIVGKVRNLIFCWALDLKDAGDAGNGPIFSDQEKKSVSSLTITNTGNLTVVAGSMNESQVQQADNGSTQTFTYASNDIEAIVKIVEEIKAAIDSLDLKEEKKAEVKADLETLTAQIKSPSPKATIIKAALYSLITIFGQVSSDVVSAWVIRLLGICGR